jgi:dihydroneopterin aldolase
MSDRIVLRGIQVYAYHGVLPAEKKLGQRFVVDVTLFGDYSQAARSDDLHDAVDYSRVHALVCEAMEHKSFNLIEAAAGHLCTVLLENTAAEKVEVTIEKSTPPIPGFTGQALVSLLRDRKWLEN